MRREYTNGYYEGDMDSYNDPHGSCTFYWKDGDKYKGGFVLGKRHSHGTYYFRYGERYVGNFYRDKRSGNGKPYDSDGDIMRSFFDGYDTKYYMF